MKRGHIQRVHLGRAGKLCQWYVHGDDKKFNFMNIAGNALQDIMETVLTMEYNAEFNAAGAAQNTLAGTHLAVTRRPLDDAAG
jgi:hypothetical protein